jgi:hypothetical protein
VSYRHVGKSPNSLRTGPWGSPCRASNHATRRSQDRGQVRGRLLFGQFINLSHLHIGARNILTFRIAPTSHRLNRPRLNHTNNNLHPTRQLHRPNNHSRRLLRQNLHLRVHNRRPDLHRKRGNPLSRRIVRLIRRKRAERDAAHLGRQRGRV